MNVRAITGLMGRACFIPDPDLHLICRSITVPSQHRVRSGPADPDPYADSDADPEQW